MSVPVPPSSHARETPTSVPATQNTAPVIKFRCLYTHDIRRKAKRWQDGFLKFHTFNKRAMVYDDAGNFIGDHHWRASQGIRDGDELELDKGVLIQVSECMETTQTDISVLFERRKASQESPQKQNTPAPRPPVSGVAPHVRQQHTPARPLKSLNDLLGIQKGPLGRSVAPKSPYEQCHRIPSLFQSRQQEDERPAKRQKSSLASEILQRKSTNEPLGTRSDVIDLDASLPKASSKPVAVSRAKRGSEEPTSVSRPHQERPEGPPPEQARLPIPKPPMKADSSMQLPSEKPTEKSKPRVITGVNTARAPINPLRMRSEKPRQKLMYRGLLPPKTSDTLPLGEAQPKSNQTANGGESLYDPDPDFSLTESTLAVLEELDIEHSNATTRPQRALKTSISQDIATRSLHRIPTHAAVFGSLASPAGVELGNESGPLPSSPPEMQDTDHGDVPMANHRLVPVIRSHSDMAVMNTETAVLPTSEADQSAMTSTAIIKRQERKLFRKSHSDTNALQNPDVGSHGPSRPLATHGPPREERNNGNVIANANTNANNATGPWTADALDFFDWWPPGRPVPT